MQASVLIEAQVEKYLDTVTTMKPDGISAIQLGRKSSGQSQGARSRDEGRPGSIKSLSSGLNLSSGLKFQLVCNMYRCHVCVLSDG